MIKKYSTLLFGTAGIPHSAKKRKTPEGIEEIKKLNLDAMEIAFTHGIYMKKEEDAKACKKAALQNGVVLSVHAPYYLNLNSDKPETIKKSKWFIYQSAKMGALAGARCVVIHPGYYGKTKSKEETYQTIKKNLQEVAEQLQKEGIDISICPETTGRITQFGTIDEILRLCAELKNVNVIPCLDFAHMWARKMAENIYILQNGKEEIDGYTFAKEILEKVEKTLGKQALHKLHIHMSGIEYGKSGERYHEPLEESKFPWMGVLKALKEKDATGVVICESPILEKDAILMKNYYKNH